MHDLMNSHLDDFTLLRYVAEDLDDVEEAAVADHLSTCDTCRKAVEEIEELDRELKAIADNRETCRDFELEDLPADDPFRLRPSIAARTRRRVDDPGNFAVTAVVASEEGEELSTVILESASGSDGDLNTVLRRIDLSDPAHRFALLYALQKSGTQIAECPSRFLSFAERTLSLLGPEAGAASEKDLLIETAALLGQAQQLVGQACLWTGDFERAKSAFLVAYRFFGQVGDELALAKIEQLEAQRRFFTAEGGKALPLVRRALASAEAIGVEDEIGRCRTVEGMALQQLGRHEEAVEAFRSALPAFEKLGLWSNYVGAVNSVATSLVVLGRLSEARSHFAKALRRLSRDQHRSWLPFIRKGLAEVLFAAGRYREAAISAAQAARLYSENGMISRCLMSNLYEVESWARAGEAGRARHRLALFREAVRRQGVLDPTLSGLIEQAFSGAVPDYQKLKELRESAESALAERLGRRHA